jgi:hypothetical protein
MSYKLVDQIIRKSRAASGSAKAILIAMATYAEDDGTNIFPAMNNLADDAGVTQARAATISFCRRTTKAKFLPAITPACPQPTACFSSFVRCRWAAI